MQISTSNSNEIKVNCVKNYNYSHLIFPFFLNKRSKANRSGQLRNITKKELRTTFLILVLCINCFFGYFPNKLANNIMLYFLDTVTYNFYIAFSNALIWFSHGIKLFINLKFNEEFRETFFLIIGRPIQTRISSSSQRSQQVATTSRAAQN